MNDANGEFGPSKQKVLQQLVRLREAVTKVEGEQIKAETRDKRYKDAQLQFNSRTVLLNLFLVLFSAIGGGLVWWQSHLLKQSNEINREALQAVQRAFVNFKLIEFHRVIAPGGHMVEFRQIWENSGTTPAIDVLRYGHRNLQVGEPTEDQFLGSEIPYDANVTVIAPKAIGITLGEYTPEEDLKDHAPKRLYIWGWSYYRDVFNGTRPHVSETCMYVSRVDLDLKDISKPGSFDFTSCKAHNCADERCVDYSQIVEKVRHFVQ